MNVSKITALAAGMVLLWGDGVAYAADVDVNQGLKDETARLQAETALENAKADRAKFICGVVYVDMCFKIN